MKCIFSQGHLWPPHKNILDNCFIVFNTFSYFISGSWVSLDRMREKLLNYVTMLLLTLKLLMISNHMVLFCMVHWWERKGKLELRLRHHIILKFLLDLGGTCWRKDLTEYWNENGLYNESILHKTSGFLHSDIK